MGDIAVDIDKEILENIDIDIDIDKDKGIIKIPIKQWCKMGAKSDHFCPFSAYLGVSSPVLLMEYRIFISIVDISANLENIGIDINIDKEILENIDIDIDIDKEILENIDIEINIDKGIIKISIKEWIKMSAKYDNFCLFLAYFHCYLR